MLEITPDQYKQTIESGVGGTATFAHSVRVRVARHGMPVWEDMVHIFDLAGHAKAARAYSWSSPIKGSAKWRFFTVLHTGRIKSALDAVRAAIVEENRG